MEDFLQGATAMSSAVVATFFLRFWRDSKDRLFGIFALAFYVFALSRVLLVVIPDAVEQRTYIYTGRLAMYVLIIYAIVDKNVRRT